MTQGHSQRRGRCHRGGLGSRYAFLLGNLDAERRAPIRGVQELHCVRVRCNRGGRIRTPFGARLLGLWSGPFAGDSHLAAAEFREESAGAIPVFPVRVSVQPDQLLLFRLRILDGRQGEQERKHDDVCRQKQKAYGCEEERKVNRMSNVAVRSALEQWPFLGQLAVHILPGEKRPRREQWQAGEQEDGTENLETLGEWKGERPRLPVENGRSEEHT